MHSLRKWLSKTPQVGWPLFGLVNFLSVYAATVITFQVLDGTFTHIFKVVGLTAIIVILFMTIVFAISRLLKRTDLVDAAWGLAITVAAIASFVIGEQTIGWNVQTLIVGLIAVWGVRLSYTISVRFRRTEEDKRYIELRKKWHGNEALNTYGRIFIVQAIFATIIGLGSVTVNALEIIQIGVIALIGVIVWLVGFIFESIGDWQLKQFLADKSNKGKLMTKGLWQYTRHPNYFGEAAQWWGIFIIAVSLPQGWLAIISPVLITYLLLFVSGVPMTEKAFEGRKGWKAYQKQTSKFLPLPPRKV
jgi:steroid 5-alpha reductase family enzyme